MSLKKKEGKTLLCAQTSWQHEQKKMRLQLTSHWPVRIIYQPPLVSIGSPWKRNLCQTYVGQPLSLINFGNTFSIRAGKMVVERQFRSGIAKIALILNISTDTVYKGFHRSSAKVCLPIIMNFTRVWCGLILETKWYRGPIQLDRSVQLPLTRIVTAHLWKNWSTENAAKLVGTGQQDRNGRKRGLEKGEIHP